MHNPPVRRSRRTRSGCSGSLPSLRRSWSVERSGVARSEGRCCPERACSERRLARRHNVRHCRIQTPCLRPRRPSPPRETQRCRRTDRLPCRHQRSRCQSRHSPASCPRSKRRHRCHCPKQQRRPSPRRRRTSCPRLLRSGMCPQRQKPRQLLLQRWRAGRHESFCRRRLRAAPRCRTPRLSFVGARKPV